jgi:hypothetical protein
VTDWVGDRTHASAAKALGISLPTLRKLLAGESVRAATLEQVQKALREEGLA